MNAFTDPDMDLDPVDVARRHAAGELVLVDMREPYEWEAGHVPGSSHVRWSASPRWPPRSRAIARSRSSASSGVRSGLVAQGFRAVGYEAYNVEGGFTLWCTLGLPIEPEGATAAPAT